VSDLVLCMMQPRMSGHSGFDEKLERNRSSVDCPRRCFSRLIRLYKCAMTDAQVEEIKRHFGIVAEALRSDIRQVAEGHSGIRHELQEIGDQFRDDFKEMRAVMRLSFS